MAKGDTGRWRVARDHVILCQETGEMSERGGGSLDEGMRHVWEEGGGEELSGKVDLLSQSDFDKTGLELNVTHLGMPRASCRRLSARHYVT